MNATPGRQRPSATAYRPPAWVRALAALDRATQRAANVVASVRDEALLAWIAPEDRTSLTTAVYADAGAYLPGGSRFRGGLFSWEARILSSAPFPASGRLLLGAAGAGRELVALVERGYDVVAFDPCLPFVQAARELFPAGKAGVTVVQASYRDLVDAVALKGGGELASVIAGAPFDAVILGWGSLSHVMPASARAELLGALRRLAPRAPVLASFGLENGPGDLAESMSEQSERKNKKGRVRSVLRRAFAALGAPGTSEDRDHFAWNAGFFANLTHEELVETAEGARYHVARFEDGPYPHALLVPRPE